MTPLEGKGRSAWRRGSLFTRIYLYGALLLVSVTLAVVVLVAATVAPQMNRQMGAFSRWIARPLLASVDDPRTAQEAADDLRAGLDLRVVLFDHEDREVISTADGARPAPLTTSERVDLLAGRIVQRPPPFSFLVATTEGTGASRRLRGWAAICPSELLVSLRPAAAGFCVVVLTLFVLSALLARSLAAPLSRVGVVARALGRGDLSARTRLLRTDEVGDVARELDDMADRIEAMRRSEKELLANVSHELRTPLARVRVAVDLAQGGGAASDMRRYFGQIAEDIAELESLLDDIITSARLDLASAQLTDPFPALSLAPEPLAPLLESVAKRFLEQHPERALSVALDGELPAIAVDAALLRRALANLLDNARKYSDGEVSLVGRPVADGAEIAISDRGCGVDGADLPRLFQPFFRTDRSRARATGGVGLGLVLTRRIVEAHGGTIVVASRVDEGTTVTIRLPLLEPDAEDGS